MPRNTGKPSETEFENSILALGKAGWFYRITDAAEVRGITGKIGLGMHATPSDYVVCVHGQLHMAEVKSTNDKVKFPFNLLKKGQLSHGRRITAARGPYQVYLHRMETDHWYSIPLRSILAVQDAGRQSIPWDMMEQFRWDLRWPSPTI